MDALLSNGKDSHLGLAAHLILLSGFLQPRKTADDIQGGMLV